MATPEEMLQTMINNMPEKTGKSLNDWHAVLKSSGLAKHGEFMKLLKGEHGVTHGFANTISQLYLKPELLEKKAESGDEADEKLLKGKDGIVDIFQKAKSQFKEVKGDVEFSYKNTYISLRTPKKQFALLQPSTKTRVDIGLNLKGVAPEGTVEAAGSWNAMVTHRVKLTAADQVDANLAQWIQKAYDANC
ncbi:DUF4287 domain-containing protein [Roseivirga misakiensis]|uniref:DUF5655 domain-containing protein n=1 Tax=Roseivirga misakiensis TaxID=1563681 RepID=A0A1E5T6K7_9BACT|nr:DUF4287 domain-containing protein [Roseivirga misakiensis]OEK07009.1 hypothetical protein BFP71_04945 [Roseivirga misakiensis]